MHSVQNFSTTGVSPIAERLGSELQAVAQRGLQMPAISHKFQELPAMEAIALISLKGNAQQTALLATIVTPTIAYAFPQLHTGSPSDIIIQRVSELLVDIAQHFGTSVLGSPPNVALQLLLSFPAWTPIDWTLFCERCKQSRYKSEFQHLKAGIAADMFTAWADGYECDRLDAVEAYHVRAESEKMGGACVHTGKAKKVAENALQRVNELRAYAQAGEAKRKADFGDNLEQWLKLYQLVLERPIEASGIADLVAFRSEIQTADLLGRVVRRLESSRYAHKPLAAIWYLNALRQNYFVYVGTAYDRGKDFPYFTEREFLFMYTNQ